MKIIGDIEDYRGYRRLQVIQKIIGDMKIIGDIEDYRRYEDYR